MIEIKVLSSVIVPEDRSRSYAGACQNCRYILPRLSEAAPIFFQRGSIACDHCGSEVDLWQAALEHSFSWSPVSLGATNTSFTKEIQTGDFYKVDLVEYGAPPDARILSMTYTGQGGPDGGVTVIEWHGNSSRQRFFGTVVNLMGVALGEGKLPRVGTVSISAHWIHREESDAWPYLVSAIESVSTQDYSPALVFAQSAVEISLMPLIAERFELHASRKRVEDFMGGDLSYGHALNVVLPYLCGELGVRQMPDAIRGSLNKLRKRRNEIIHQGVKSHSISEKEAMEAMTAAAFGFEFMSYIGPLFRMSL